jgi:hypothetical protein
MDVSKYAGIAGQKFRRGNQASAHSINVHAKTNRVLQSVSAVVKPFIKPPAKLEKLTITSRVIRFYDLVK